MDLHGDREEFVSKLQHYVDQVMQYHDPQKQELARALLPLEELEENSAIALAKEGNFDPTKEERDHFLLLQLLFWFKTSFSWVNSPPCDFCAGKTNPIGMGQPVPEDLQFGANRVELYSCELCGTVTRFPRYNDPVKLMETQCGRCGEWANCFTFYCVALGYEARLVLDYTDHVWTECYSPYLGRWMHLDPCEASYDKPLLYEKGWGKQLNYVIALSRDGVYDVTKRYTRKWAEVLSRRKLVSEDDVEELTALLTAVQRSQLAPEELDILEQRDKQEAEEIAQAQTSSTSDENLPGRQSGSKEWRMARGEFGVQHIESDRHLCPVRFCVDKHVGKIYHAIGFICSEADKMPDGLRNVGSKLKTIHGILVKLKSQPFKSRKLRLAQGGHIEVIRGKNALSLLEAIGLDRSENENGEIDIISKDNPARVALALAVALENIERINRSFSSYLSLQESPLQLMMAGQRLCGGSTYATGEQTPSGIASAAFDGLYSTKWEEPEGAKGAWLVYHLEQNAHRRIIGYDLTSANDCPERDPLDWLLEGSDDGGKTWHVLDKRAGELFQDRFERKCFRISAETEPYNALRFQFSAVRDAANSSRLQISCIDFYSD